MGRPDVAGIKRDADVATAEAERDTAIRRAVASRESAVAKALADQERVQAETLSQPSRRKLSVDLKSRKPLLEMVKKQQAQAIKLTTSRPTSCCNRCGAEEVTIEQVQKRAPW